MEKYKEYFPGEWGPLLEENKELLTDITEQLNFKVGIENKVIYPNPTKVFRAFKETPLEDVNVVILGQDPYHDGSAIGLAFDNEKNPVPTKENIRELKKLSPSLLTITKKIYSESGSNYVGEVRMNSTNTHLGHLPSQGVLLINTALTVEQSKPNSHKELWQPFTKKVIEKLNTKDNIVWILWGANALSYKELITNETHRFIVSSHPSPLSVKKPLGKYPSFEDSKPFSTANLYLEEMSKTPIRW